MASSRTRPAAIPLARRSHTALALRDRALVETAYAAGLRISELAAADLGSLDLRRGEIRVLGKGRKERIGLLGRPALAALAAYLEDGRPVLLERRSDQPVEPAEVFLNHTGTALGVRGLRYRLDRLRRLAGSAGRRLAAHAAALVCDPPARRRRRPAGRPGAARAREPGHDPDLHPRLARRACRPPIGRRIRGRVATRPRDRGHAPWPRPAWSCPGAFFISRVLGWFRLVVFARQFDASDLDTFFAAFRIPDLIFQLVAAGALSSALIPVVAGLLERDEEARAWRVVSTVVNLMLIALATLAVILFVLAPLVMRVITPGFEGQKLEQIRRADADHAAQPDPPGDGRGGHERAQRRRPVRGLGDRPDRLQPRDHRRRAPARPEPRRDGPGHRGRRRIAAATSSSSCVRCGCSAFATSRGSNPTIPRPARRCC